MQSRRQEEKKKMKQDKEKDDEKLQKKLEAQKYFDSWKQNKDEQLKVLFLWCDLICDFLTNTHMYLTTWTYIYAHGF